MKDNRYQYQSRLVKFGRWLRYRPIGIIVSLWWIAKWAYKGMKPMDFSCDEYSLGMTQDETIEHFWTLRKSMDQYKMGWYYTSDEVLANLRTK